MLPLKIKVALILLWSTGIFGNIAMHIAKRDAHILVRAEKSFELFKIKAKPLDCIQYRILVSIFLKLRHMIST